MGAERTSRVLAGRIMGALWKFRLFAGWILN